MDSSERTSQDGSATATEAADELADAVAVVGLAGRFPGAPDVDTFWRNLCSGVESVSRSSLEELAAAGIAEAIYRHPDYVPAKGRLAGFDLFDADFFGFSAHEAEQTDPQHRLFLECAWEAMENTGYDPARFPGRIGVYAGQSMNTYLVYQSMLDPAVGQAFLLDYMPTMISANDDFLATRVAYQLDLRGPAMTVQTACSSSLVAIHQACQSLLGGECDMVLAGGVSLTVPEAFGYIYREGAGVSLDGRCRAFDSTPSGIVGGSGLAVVVLRRLADALADGDTVHAVIRGSAVNNDGAGKSGFTAPSVEGQAQVVADALAVADVSADSVGLVEAHGTATPLGDPIEVAALTRAFRADTDRIGYCALGSVKTNVGHLAAAAGVTGFVKAMFAVRDGVVPPTLHFREPNPKLELETSPFFVNTQPLTWPDEQGPRRAGVTALGVGGTNAHVVLEQPPTPQATGASRKWQLLVVSGRSTEALTHAAERLADALDSTEVALADAAYTTQVGRRHFAYRRAVLCRDRSEAVRALRAPYEPAEPVGARSVAFLFPGGGSQYVGMGRSLYHSEPAFRRCVDECAELVLGDLGYDLRSVLLAPDPVPGQTAAVDRLATAEGMMVLLFTVDYALAQLWRSWGVRPGAMLGHSLGEYVAACLAGVFELGDALRTVVVRGRLLDELPAGAVLSVPLSETELRPLLGPELSLSAVNAPDQCTVSGAEAAVEALAERLADQGVRPRRLRLGQPVHSAATEAILDRFAEHLRDVTLHPPGERIVSSRTGTWLTTEEAVDPGYWVHQLRDTVRFSTAVDTLLDAGHPVLVEVGPGTVLGTLVTANLPADGPRPIVVSSLPHPRDPQPDQAYLLATLGRVWSAGVDVDWAAFSAGERRRRVPLPTYPFERQRYWVTPPGVASNRSVTPTAAATPEARAVPVVDDGAPPVEDASRPAALHQRPPLSVPYVAPGDEVEQAVVAVWQELLGFDRIGVQDNFYALGGSSLLTMRLLARLRERITADLPLEQLLTEDTVAGQARIIRGLLVEANHGRG
ncbi:type I polyketide synthase [Micromonospora sp. NPDC003197]